MMTEDFRIVPCEACGSEGRIYIATGDDRETSAPQERDGGPCPYCEGTGGEIIAVEPITLEDLEPMNDTAQTITLLRADAEIIHRMMTEFLPREEPFSGGGGRADAPVKRGQLRAASAGPWQRPMTLLRVLPHPLASGERRQWLANSNQEPALKSASVLPMPKAGCLRRIEAGEDIL